MTAIVVKREGVRQTAAREHEALLAGEVGDVFDPAKRLGMRAAGKKVRREQLSRLARRDRTIADPASGSLDLDERLEPEEAARSRAHDRNVEATAALLIENRVCDSVCADRQRRRVGGNEDAHGHCVLP